MNVPSCAEFTNIAKSHTTRNKFCINLFKLNISFPEYFDLHSWKNKEGEKVKWQSSHETSRLISLPRDNGGSEKNIKTRSWDVKTDRKRGKNTRTNYDEGVGERLNPSVPRDLLRRESSRCA